MDGFSDENMNIDEVKTNEISRRLTIVQNERTRKQTEQMGFDTKEYESMNTFYMKYVKKNDAKVSILFKISFIGGARRHI